MQLKLTRQGTAKDLIIFLDFERLQWSERKIYNFPTGLVIYYKNGKRELIGDDISGPRTQGCPCCACDREEDFIQDIERWELYTFEPQKD